MSLALRAAVALLPAHLRERYREEWKADAALAPSAGVRASEVHWGALLTAARLAGLPSPALDATRSRSFIVRDVVAWGAGAAAAAAFVGLLFLPYGARSCLLYVAPATAIVFCCGVALQRASMLGRAAQVATLGWFALVLIVAGVVGAVAWFLLFATGLPLLLVALVAAIVFAVQMGRSSRNRERHVRAVFLGLVTSLVALAFAVLDAVIWQPISMVPDLPLATMFAELLDRGEGLSLLFVGAWAAILLTIFVLIAIAAWRHRWQPRQIAAFSASSIVLTVVTQAWATFGLGMSIADTFEVSGATTDSTLVLVSVASIAAAVAAVTLLAPKPGPTTASTAPIPLV